MPKQSTKTIRPKVPTIQQAIDDYLLDCRARQCTPATIQHYQQRLGAFARWAADLPTPPATIADITPAILRAHLVHLQERGLASHTQQTHARALRAWLNSCVREGWIDVSPFSKLKMPKAARLEKPSLDAPDVRRLLAVCDQARDKALIMVMLDTGARASEVCNLNAGDFDAERLTLAIRQGKGRKDRTTYVGAKTARQVRRYLWERGDITPGDPLFASDAPLNRGGRLTRNGLGRILKGLGKAAGVPNVHPHRLRRTFAIECLRRGMDVFSLARLMGHADLATLRGYLAIAQSDLRSAHQAAGPVDHMLKK